MVLHNAFEKVATETTLAAILAELAQKLEEGGTVALSPASLAALEQVTATIANLPATYPLPNSQVQVNALTDAELRAATVEVVDFSVQTVLEQIRTELAEKLENGGTVALDAATLAALESITTTVANLPSSYPLPPSQVQTDALTDVQLRATPVPVDTGLTIPTPQTDALTNAQLRATPVPVDTGLAIPIPQTDALTNAQLRATPVPVDIGAAGDLAVADAAVAAAVTDVKRGITDYRKRIDWDADGQPIYVGLNAQAALGIDATWTIQRITWNASGQPIDVQVLTGAWDSRTTLGWSA